MRNEDEAGDIDNDGFFVFNKRARMADPWLASIAEDEDEDLAEKIRKKINTGGRFQGVYEVEASQEKAEKAYLQERPSSDEE